MIACLSDIFIGDASDISIGDLQVLSVCRSQRHLYRRDRGCSALRVTSNSRETVPARAKERTDGTGVAAGRRNSAVSPTRSPTFSARSGVHSGGEHELRPRIGAQQLLGHCSCDSASWIVRICLQDDATAWLRHMLHQGTLQRQRSRHHPIFVRLSVSPQRTPASAMRCVNHRRRSSFTNATSTA